MSHVQIGLFREHKGDPLSFLIIEETRTAYTHACIITDRLKNEISEAYAPHVRRRILDDSEVEGIDVFDINGLTAEQSQAILDECARREAVKEPYAITNLFRFNPFLRAIFGEAKDDGSDNRPVICSQYALDVVKVARPPLLNAPSYAVDPGHVAWSTELTPAPPLKPLGIQSGSGGASARTPVPVAGEGVSFVPTPPAAPLQP